MIIRVGFKTFEFQRALELPKPMIFASDSEALKWLEQLEFTYPQTILPVREYLTRLSNDWECSRLTDHEAIERMARLLYTRKVVVVVRELGGGSGSPTAKPEAIPIAFPLAERVSRATTTAAPVEESATFDPRLDAVAQAAALVAAASEGKPFCPE